MSATLERAAASPGHPFSGLAGESLLYAAAGATAKALALITVPFLSRSLGPADYGLTDLATSTAAMVTIVAMFSGDVPTARLASKEPGSHERRRTFGIYVMAVTIAGIVAAALLLPAGGLIASNLWSSPDSANLAVLAVVLVPVSATQAALVTVQRLAGRPKTFAVLATIDLIAQLALAVAFVALGFGPHGVLIGLIAGSAIGLVAAAVAARNLVTIRFDVGACLRLIRLGLPFLPAITAFVAADFIARALVADRLGQPAVGALGVAVRLASVLALMSATFQLAWGPRGLAMDPSPQSAYVFGRVMLAYALLAGSVCLALSSVGPEVVSVVSGAPYLPAAAMLPGFAAAAVAAGSYFVLAVGAGISGRSGSVAISSILGAGVQVGLTAVLITQLGLLGVGIGAIAGRLVSLATLMLRVRGVFDERLWTASATLAGVAGLSGGIGWLNLHPDETASIRFLIAAAATIGCATALRTLLKRPPAASA